MREEEIWVIAEINQRQQIKDIAFELLAWAKPLSVELNVPLSAIIIGRNLPKEEIEELICRGADRVYVLNHEYLFPFIVENHSTILEHLIKSYHPQIVIAGATTQGRTLMPHLSAKLNTGLTADCTDLQIEKDTGLLLQIRPAIGGNIMATIKTIEKKPQMATIRPKSKKKLPKNKNKKGLIIPIKVNLSIFDNESRVEHLGFQKNENEEMDLSSVDIIVSGGRGFKKKENLTLLNELAKQLKAAVGASREVVDRGWISYSHQVGLSGKTVNPKLYLALGISGAIQHLAGIKTSETIVAINNDPQADIFKIADFGIVGDLFEILPLLKQKLEEKRKPNEI